MYLRTSPSSSIFLLYTISEFTTPHVHDNNIILRIKKNKKVKKCNNNYIFGQNYNIYNKLIKYYNYYSKVINMKNNNISKYLSSVKIVSLIIGIIILLLDIIIITKDIIDEQKSVEIEAKVTSLEYQNTNSSNAKITYEVNNKIYEPSITVKDNLAVGDKVKIKYDKNNPQKIINNNHILMILISIPIILILFKVGLLYSISYLKTKKKINYLKKHGIVINAPILEVYIKNQKAKVNKNCPYVVRVKYVNPQDNSAYVFESEETYENLKDRIEIKGLTTLPVYLNPKDTNSYYVDISDIIN